MAPAYEILKDPIHGYIKVFKHELQIIDTPIFQRLRRIKQNTGVDYVYPGATHTRFSHSLGVMHVAGVFTEHLLDQIPNLTINKKKKYFYLIRLWGLTHDIGHGPFSHVFDDVIFIPLYNTDHEKFGAKILRECTQLPRQVEPEKGIQIEMDEVASLFEAKSVEEWPLDKRISKNVNEKIFYYVCRGAYSADIIDFLIRDSYFTGAGYGNIDWQRLIFSSIPSNDKILLNPRGKEAFDSLLLARLFMFSAVYYHRTTRAVIKVVTNFLEEAANKLQNLKEFIENVDNFASLDEQFLLFHPDLESSLYRQQLINRTIPYSKFEEQDRKIDLNISDKALSKLMTQQVRSRLPGELQSLPDEAFFVDTPIFKLNPLFGEEDEYIFIYDEKRPQGFKPQRIYETPWGNLEKKLLLMRLYIHDNYQNYEKQIVQAFIQREKETHV
jgi:HD superfamily phosphohydrolase